jgi:tetratricopeptide (TPR) repeat protein
MRTRWIAWAFTLALAGCAGSHPQGEQESGLAIDPNASPAALVALSDSALAQAEPALARRALERAASLDPKSASVRLGYGRFYTAIQRYKDAKTEFERAQTLDPSSPEPAYGLGIAYLKAGQQDLAYESLSRALRIDPTHEGARSAIRPMLEERYRRAGVPPEYASIPERASVSRGDLGVILAVEAGLDPDRVSFRSDAPYRVDWPAIDRAWGSRWLRASVGRGWIAPMADRDLHLDDPLTRGTLAVLLGRIEAESPRAPSDTTRTATHGVAAVFPDLGSRHYLGHAAALAVALGLPTRDSGRFEADALATGLETLTAVRGLARRMGAMPVVSTDPAALVK